MRIADQRYLCRAGQQVYALLEFVAASVGAIGVFTLVINAQELVRPQESEGPVDELLHEKLNLVAKGIHHRNVLQLLVIQEPGFMLGVVIQVVNMRSLDDVLVVHDHFLERKRFEVRTVPVFQVERVYLQELVGFLLHLQLLQHQAVVHEVDEFARALEDAALARFTFEYDDVLGIVFGVKLLDEAIVILGYHIVNFSRLVTQNDFNLLKRIRGAFLALNIEEIIPCKIVKILVSPSMKFEITSRFENQLN